MPFYYKSHNKPAPNSFVARARKIYKPLGFQKGYNFPLWIIFAGAALGFCASRAEYLDYDGTYGPGKVVPGDWEYQKKGRWRVGLIMHLICVIPIGFLIPWQFVPAIRRKFMLFHRLNGYLLMTLLIVGNVGAVMIVDKSLGGALDTRITTGFNAIFTTFAIIMAYVNIKRLQIDQHRAWMLRAWVYAFIIITQRLLQLAAQEFTNSWANFHVPMACHSVEFVFSNVIQPGLAQVFYPECAGNPNLYVAVLANTRPTPSPEGIPRLDQIGAAVQVTFGPTLTLALLIHAFGVETYLHLTQAEANRLKRVSYEKQLERGWARPGDASWLTKETWGDMDEFDYGLKNAELEDAVKPEPVLSEDIAATSPSA